MVEGLSADLRDLLYLTGLDSNPTTAGSWHPDLVYSVGWVMKELVGRVHSGP